MSLVAAFFNPRGFLFLLLLILVAFALISVPAPALPKAGESGSLSVPGVGNVKLNPAHPFVNHSADDVSRVRSCLRDNGTYRIYREPVGSAFRWHLICREPITGSFLTMVVEKIQGKMEEISSFPVKGGTTTWTDVEAWLIRKGATRWTKPLP